MNKPIWKKNDGLCWLPEFKFDRILITSTVVPSESVDPPKYPGSGRMMIIAHIILSVLWRLGVTPTHWWNYVPDVQIALMNLLMAVWWFWKKPRSYPSIILGGKTGVSKLSLKPLWTVLYTMKKPVIFFPAGRSVSYAPSAKKTNSGIRNYGKNLAQKTNSHMLTCTH